MRRGRARKVFLMEQKKVQGINTNATKSILFFAAVVEALGRGKGGLEWGKKE